MNVETTNLNYRMTNVLKLTQLLYFSNSFLLLFLYHGIKGCLQTIKLQLQKIATKN